MRNLVIAAVLALLLPWSAFADESDRTHLPMPPRPEGQPPAAFSNGVLIGKTLYISGHTSGKPTGSTADEAKVALDGIKSAITAAGMTMDDLVWVQVFCTDLTLYNDFNTAYGTYFKGPLPARAFLGTDKLLGGSHFEVMGIAIKK